MDADTIGLRFLGAPPPFAHHPDASRIAARRPHVWSKPKTNVIARLDRAIQ
jgi:hypothetical protein